MDFQGDRFVTQVYAHLECRTNTIVKVLPGNPSIDRTSQWRLTRIFYPDMWDATIVLGTRTFTLHNVEKETYATVSGADGIRLSFRVGSNWMLRSYLSHGADGQQIQYIRRGKSVWDFINDRFQHFLNPLAHVLKLTVTQQNPQNGDATFIVEGLVEGSTVHLNPVQDYDTDHHEDLKKQKQFQKSYQIRYELTDQKNRNTILVRKHQLACVPDSPTYVMAVPRQKEIQC